MTITTWRLLPYGRLYICIKYSIPVGKDNKYGHPNKEILEILKESKIYRTDQDGEIMLKINNNKLKIEKYKS